jgi:hypothetical protein
MPKLNIIFDKLNGKVDQAVIDMMIRMQDQTAMLEHKVVDLIRIQAIMATLLRELLETTQNVLSARKAKDVQQQISAFDKKHEQNSPLNPEDIDITSRTEGN